jgi:hypothetical protein
MLPYADTPLTRARPELQPDRKNAELKSVIVAFQDETEVNEFGHNLAWSQQPDAIYRRSCRPGFTARPI